MTKREFAAQTSAKEFSLVERALGVAVNSPDFNPKEKRELKTVFKRAQQVNALDRRSRNGTQGE